VQKLQSIQVLRAVAACSVVAMHSVFVAYDGDSNFAGFGAAGVDLFFVISGFIMGTVAPGRRVGEFVSSRLRRIYPIYVVAALPWILAAVISGRDVSARTLLVDSTLWPLWGAFQRPTLGVGWTLCFEMTFYASVAFVLWSGRWRLALGAYGFFLLAGLTTGIPLLAMLGSPLFLSFLAGVLIVHLPKHPKIGLVLAAIGIAMILLVPATVTTAGPLTIFDPQLSLVRVALWGLPAALIVYGAVSWEPVFASPLCKPLAVLGNASYSIYLFQMVAIRLAPGPWYFRAALAVGLGTMIWWQLERRLLDWFKPRQRDSNKERGAVAPAVYAPRTVTNITRISKLPVFGMFTVGTIAPSDATGIE